MSGETSIRRGNYRSLNTAMPKPKLKNSKPLYILTGVVTIGGFLFGFDTGVISGALPYIRDDLLINLTTDQSRLAFMQEVIVVAAILAACVGAAGGGMVSDAIGRKKALALSDILFTIGSLLMAAAKDPDVIISGRVLVGLGIGLSSVVVPIYLAECAPAEIRGRLVTFNVLAITFGQFAAYVSNFIFSFVPWTWRWMLGIAAVPAVVQFVCVLSMPESPRWLQSKGQAAAASEALRQLEADGELRIPVAEEGGSLIESSSKGGKISAWQLLFAVPKQLHLGVGLQVLQQLCGINTVMYYLPVILQIAGIQDKRTALLFSLLPASVNAAGTAIGMLVVEKQGRQKLLLTSLAAVCLALLGLGAAFKVAETQAPNLSGAGNMCRDIIVTSCTQCLQAGCGYCASIEQLAAAEPGVCMALESSMGCVGDPARKAVFFTVGCPSSNAMWILGALVLYLLAFSPGLGTVPWTVVSEIFPINIRATAAGIAAASNWIANAIIAQTFLTLVHSVGGAGTFWLYSFIAALGFVWTSKYLPETKGLSLDEIQRLF